MSLTANVYLYYELQQNKSDEQPQQSTRISKKLAFTKQLVQENDQYYLVLDEIEWFSGDEAEQAAEEDNNPEAASLSNGFYIRNKTMDHEKVRIEQDTPIFVMDGTTQQNIGFDAFISSDIQDKIFHVRIVDHTIVFMQEQYRP